nr:MAG TPA: hypothetical protein [Bacteriophage sp.]
MILTLNQSLKVCIFYLLLVLQPRKNFLHLHFYHKYMVL